LVEYFRHVTGCATDSFTVDRLYSFVHYQVAGCVRALLAKCARNGEISPSHKRSRLSCGPEMARPRPAGRAPGVDLSLIRLGSQLYHNSYADRPAVPCIIADYRLIRFASYNVTGLHGTLNFL